MHSSDDGKSQPAAKKTVVASTIAAPPPNPQLPLSTTSSMKRHHKEMSGSRKAKMDALLQELEHDKHRDSSTRHRDRQRGPPMKKGSYVEPGQEHITTNLFVGNLATTLTEEEVTNVFRQFGRNDFVSNVTCGAFKTHDFL